MNEDLTEALKHLQKIDQQMLDTENQFSKILENYLSRNINKINKEYQGDVYNYFVTELEKVLLLEVLKNKNGNQLKASELLGLNRNTLRKKITELNINIDQESN
jgi:DNA-binding protein Fis